MLAKSNAANGVLAAASRAVSAGRFHFSPDEPSAQASVETSEQTLSGRANGDTITARTRIGHTGAAKTGKYLPSTHRAASGARLRLGILRRPASAA